MKAKQTNITKKHSRPAESGQSMNRLFWIIIVLIILGGSIANFHFNAIDWALRAAAAVPLAAIVVFLALRTAEGQKAWVFIKSARNELNKVVWPSRQETIQTTLIVVAMVVVTAVFLWGIDSLFLWLVSLLTGQRG